MTVRKAAPLTLCRLNQGLSQEELARRAGVARESVSRIECGRKPTLETAQALAAALDYPFELVFPPSHANGQEGRR